MSIAFLITSPYQVYHYKQIAAHLGDVTAVIEVREKEFGLSEEFVGQHLTDCEIETIAKERLSTLDGRFDAIVCQTPILPLAFLEKSLIIAQQYSLAKEQYQYGVWRAHAHLNLMYGAYSVEMVSGFSHAIAVGNPLLDTYFAQQREPRRAITADGPSRPRLLYMPTYGELSSLKSVVSRLRGLDAEVTLKLHHAHDLGSVGKVPDDVRIVYADADPASLLREHDGVISDFSGAAFDALYAGLPVVLTGMADPRAKDFARLSPKERDHSLLRDVAALWPSGDDLFAAFERAERLLETPQYDAFQERLFVNRGSAGIACADEIRRLLVDGPPSHFGAQQVRETTKRYITTNRELRGRLSREPLGQAADGSKQSKRGPRQRLAGAYSRLRNRLAKSRKLRAVGRRGRAVLRRLRARQAASGPLPPPGPRERRQAVFQALVPYLQEAGVSVALDDDTPGSDAAILTAAVPQLQRALRMASSSRPDFEVRLGKGTRVVATRSLGRVSVGDIRNAEWLEIGSTRELSPYRIASSGYLTVLLVEHDPARNRYLALRSRARGVDWTPLFGSDDAQGSDRVVLGVGVRRKHICAPVDAVYTWVDSTDPAWREAHRKFSGQHEVHNISANNDERYVDRDELRYSLRSLWTFAPFIRNIYIVTADQHPSWLRPGDPRVTVISHREVFPDASVLPTFNSHAIEACLHRIPGLAENFLYLNDDVFLGREAAEQDFFTRAGLAKVRMSPTQFIYGGKPEVSAIPTDWAGYNSTRLIEEEFGLMFDRRVQHVPLPLKKSVLEEIEHRYPKEVERTRAARFRSVTDIALPSMFAQYYAIATGRAVEWPPTAHGYIYLDTGRKDALDRYDWIYRRRPRFFCLNVTRHTEVDLASQAKHLSAFLSSAFPTAAPWEV